MKPSSRTAGRIEMKKRFVSFVILLAGLASGCMSLHKNPPLEKVGQPDAYSFNNIQQKEGGAGENLMVVALSGGGARAGALSYGVFKQLEKVKLPEGESLLDEVKVISSVSGGSFVSAYYGLYGKEKFFRDFKKEVLYRKLNTRILISLLRFVNWVPIAISGDLGRSEIAQNLYDDFYFKHSTFKDMPRKWPYIMINSTDMSRGTSFSFVREDFDPLCSDLSGVKIARAVVASSAFPGPFTPMTFKNYPKSQCGYQLPEWVDQTLAKSPDENLEQFIWAQNLKSYEDAGHRPYIHLMDGGIGDNLGLRPVLDHFRKGDWDVLDEERRFKAKRLILITVNAKLADSIADDKKSKIPKMMTVLLNAATKPMGNFSAKTVQEFAIRLQENRAAEKNFATLKKLCDQVHSTEAERNACYQQFEAPFGGIHKPPFPKMYLMIHIQFESIKDKAVKAQVNKIGTSLQLPKTDIDLLEKTAGELLMQSADFQKLMQDLHATIEDPNRSRQTAQRFRS